MGCNPKFNKDASSKQRPNFGVPGNRGLESRALRNFRVSAAFTARGCCDCPSNPPQPPTVLQESTMAAVKEFTTELKALIAKAGIPENVQALFLERDIVEPLDFALVVKRIYCAESL